MSKKKKCSEKVMMCLKKSYLRTLHSHQQNRSLIKIKFTFKQIHELLMHIFMVFVKKKIRFQMIRQRFKEFTDVIQTCHSTNRFRHVTLQIESDMSLYK